MNERPASWVVDASAMLPIVDLEPCSDRARQWYGGLDDRLAESATLDLFDVECANALWKRVRREQWPLEAAEQALSRVLNLPVRRVAAAEFVNDALRLAVTLGLSVYDACYLALALASGLPLVTADRRLAQGARTAGCDVLCFTDEPAVP